MARFVMWLRVLGAISSGALLRLAFPTYDLIWLLWPALALLLWSIHGTSTKAGALLGLLHGLTFYLWLLPWLEVIGVDAWILLSTAMALWSALLGSLLSISLQRAAWLVLAPTMFVATEFLRSTWPFGGFSWGRIAFTSPTPFSAWAWLIGAAGVTFLNVLVAGMLLVAVRSVARRRALPALVVTSLIAALALAPVLGVSVSTADYGSVNAAVIQGNVPRLGLDFNAQRRAVLDNHVEVTSDLAEDVRAGTVAPPDFVIWPENASDIDPFTNPTAGALIQRAVNDVGVDVLVGAVLQKSDTELTNTGIVWTPGQGATERYSKLHLVPFGEYVPFRSILAPLISRFDRVQRDFVRGERPGNLTIDGVRLGAVICFEIAYDDVVRDVAGRSGLLVVQTNNATYGLSGQPQQQLAITRLRAIEHGRSVLVAATSGVSAIIQPDGSIRSGDQLQEFTAGYLAGQVAVRPESAGRTPGARLGSLPEWFAVLVMLLLVAVASRPIHRRGEGEEQGVEAEQI